MNIKIDMKKILENSIHKIPAIAKVNAGENTLKMYLEIMKDWPEEEIDEIFDNMPLRMPYRYSKNMGKSFKKMMNVRTHDPRKRPRPLVVARARRHVSKALKRIFKQIKHDIQNEIDNSLNANDQIITVASEMDIFPEPECELRELSPSAIAKTMISREGIRGKFADAEIQIQFDASNQ